MPFEQVTDGRGAGFCPIALGYGVGALRVRPRDRGNPRALTAISRWKKWLPRFEAYRLRKVEEPVDIRM
jgi:hypothetical protein